MTESKVKQVLYSLDLFPTNPTWRVNGVYYLSTWKSICFTLLIMLASLGLSYDTIRQLVADKQLLPVKQVYDRGDSTAPDPFLVGFTFQTEEDTQNITITAIDNTRDSPGLVERQRNCPSHMATKLGWTLCFLVTMPSMPLTGGDSNNFLNFPWLVISTETNNSFNLYLETFNIPAAIGSSPKKFTTKEIAPGTSCIARTLKSRLRFSNSVVDRQAIQRFEGVTLLFSDTNCNTNQNIAVSTLEFMYHSEDPIPSYTVTRISVFYFLGVLLGWSQLFTMVFSTAFFTLNSFNAKLKICRTLSNDPTLLDTHISTLVFIKIVFVYALDATNCRAFLRKLKEKGYLKQEIACFTAFENLDHELSVQNVNRSINVLKNQMSTDGHAAPSHFDYHFQQSSSDGTALYNMLSTQRYSINKVLKRKPKKLVWWRRFLRWFDTNSRNVEYQLNRSQRSSILSIVITYSWIFATILLVYLLGILSLTSAPITVKVISRASYTFSIDFSDYPIYLYRPDFVDPSQISVTEVNASLIDTTTLRVVKKLNIANGSDCPQPSDTFPKNGTPVYCLTGTADVSFNDDVDTSLIISVAYTGAWTSGVELNFANYYCKTNEVYSKINTVGILGGDGCLLYDAKPYYNNGVPTGFSLPPTSNDRFSCGGLVDPADNLNVFNFVFRMGERILVRKQSTIDFFSTTEQGWNVSLIFIAVLAYLVTRPYNKRVALHSVASGAALDEQREVDMLLDVSHLLLYLRAKEAVMGSDRFFYKQQLKQERNQ